jgi:cell division protein FtsB
MRWLVLLLLLAFGALQYRLWVGDGSLEELHTLRQQIADYKAEIAQMKARNRALLAEVEDLKHGQSAIEERARSELGMIKQGEVFLQVIEQDKGGND